MQAERRKFDVIQFLSRLAFQSQIAPDGKGDLQPTCHHDTDLPILVVGAQGLVNQSAHATSGL